MPESDSPNRSSAEASAKASASPQEVKQDRRAKSPEALDPECEKRLDEIADLITRIRHEINNPLTGVLGQAQLLLREDLTESARRRVTTIEEQAIRIRDIVAQLRQVQKGAKG